MTSAIVIRDLPLAWYDRPQYRPRIDVDGRSDWFLLAPSFRPEERMPLAPPREPPFGRAALRAAFEETYEAWNLPLEGDARSSLEAIASDGTGAVVCGQQPGFLGGPLHTVYKALSTIAAARRYRALTGRACVPVFWVAGDDHDFEEVRGAFLPGPGGEEAAFRFPGEADRRPVADYAVDGAALEVLEAAARHLEGRRFGAKARSLIDLYRGRGLAGGFAAILADLLGHAGLLLVDPVRLRPLAARIFRSAIEEPSVILRLVEAGRAEVEARGLQPLVAGRLPLFLVRDGKRHHLSPAPGGLAIDGGGPALSVSEAVQALALDPRCFSPGALLRPIVQEECLPCVLSIGGPAEVGYFAQIGPLAAHFGLERPRIALRLNATLVEGKLARFARALDREAIARARSPEELLEPATGPEPEPLRALRDLAARAEETLLRAVDAGAPREEADRLRKRAKDIARDISSLTERLERSVAGAQSRETDEARRLWSFIFPSGALQERRSCVLHFIAKHGTEWLDELTAGIEEDPLRVVHRWVEFGV